MDGRGEALSVLDDTERSRLLGLCPSRLPDSVAHMCPCSKL